MTDSTGSVVPDFLEVAARAHPTRLALSYAGKRWSFAELHRAVSSTARFLQPVLRDARPGRLGILSANRPGFVFAVHAAARIDACFVPLNWRQTAVELAWQIEAADIAVIVVDDEHRELAEAAIDGLQVILLPMSDLENAPGIDRAADPAPPIALGRDAAVMFTSGTSGRPKGARLTYGNFWFSAVASALTLGQHEQDMWLAVLSLFHIGGLAILYRGVIGATPVALQERFNPSQALEEIDRGASLVSLAPGMLRRMIDERGDVPWPESLRTVLLGGGPAPQSLIAECLERRVPIAPTYGLTESSSQATTLPPGEVRSHIGSSGVALPITRLRIVERGQSLAPRNIGEIELLGPSLFQGYLGEGERAPTSAWFATGDAGYLDEEGFLYVVDRRQDLIVSGGENVYPAEIERVLLEHPLVVDAGVIGFPDETWGMRPVAAVVWRGNPGAAANTLKEYCQSRLARYKSPDCYRIVEKLPRSASGKLLRRNLGVMFESADESPD